MITQGVFTSAAGRNIEVGIGPFVTSQMLSSRGVYNAHQPGFPLHLLGDQLQKAGVSGDWKDGWLWRMLRAARCIPHKHWASSWGDRKDMDLIKSDVHIWLLISTHRVNVIYTHAHTHTYIKYVFQNKSMECVDVSMRFTFHQFHAHYVLFIGPHIVHYISMSIKNIFPRQEAKIPVSVLNALQS